MSSRSVPARCAGEKYLALVRDSPVRPVRTGQENERAIEVVAALGSHKLTPVKEE